MIGPGSLVERLTARQHGDRIPWDRVRKVEADRIIVTPDARRRKRSG
jgi:sporulation protein YlmC with PRC-barrel domain